MDILKKRVAPITTDAWVELEKTAKKSIISMLSARKVLKVNGPKGIDFTAVACGKLENLQGDSSKGEVCTGNYQLQRLTEARISFEIPKWTLDNIERGDENPDLDVLEDAAKKLALFEERAIFNGYDPGQIYGLQEVAGHTFKLGKDPQKIQETIGEARYALFESFAEGPFDLLVSPEVYKTINVVYEGANLYRVIKKLIGGDIIRSKVLKGALLIPHRDEDLEFTVGQDFALGYEGDVGENVRLFLTESFTFRCLEPMKVVRFN